MSKIATLQPSSARRRVMARPMPWPPPVTIATLPDKPLKVSLPCFATLIPWRPPAACHQPRSTTLGQRKTTLREHLAGADGFHDLDCSARNLDDPDDNIGACDGIFRHIAPAA